MRALKQPSACQPPDFHGSSSRGFITPVCDVLFQTVALLPLGLEHGVPGGKGVLLSERTAQTAAPLPKPATAVIRSSFYSFTRLSMAFAELRRR
jgi:hypothetical protein